MRKLTYYIAISIDGFIAGPHGETEFYPVSKELLEHMSTEYPDLSASHSERARNRRTQCAFRHDHHGRATYDPALKEGITSPYPHLRQYVVSKSLTTSPHPEVTVVADDPVGVVRKLKAEEGMEIYLVGGGRLAGALFRRSTNSS